MVLDLNFVSLDNWTGCSTTNWNCLSSEILLEAAYFLDVGNFHEAKIGENFVYFDNAMLPELHHAAQVSVVDFAP